MSKVLEKDIALKHSPKAKYLKQKQHNVDRIKGVIQSDFRLLLRRLIPEMVLEELADGYAKTERWQNMEFSDQFKPQDFQENDLDHIHYVLKTTSEIKTKCPKMWQELTQGKHSAENRLLTMLLVHDLGEIVVGDMIAGHNDPEVKAQHKAKEKQAALDYINNNSHVSAAVRYALHKLYLRFEEKHDGDCLVFLGQFVDKLNAIEVLTDTIWPESRRRNQHYRMLSNVQNNLERCWKLAQQALKNCSQEAKEELQQFFQKKVLGKLAQYPEADVQEYIKNFNY